MLVAISFGKKKKGKKNKYLQWRFLEKEICAQGSGGIWRDHFWPAGKYEGLSYRDGVNRHLTSQRGPPLQPCSKGYTDVWKWLGFSVSANLAKLFSSTKCKDSGHGTSQSRDVSRSPANDADQIRSRAGDWEPWDPDANQPYIRVRRWLES